MNAGWAGAPLLIVAARAVANQASILETGADDHLAEAIRCRRAHRWCASVASSLPNYE
jgi:hypothetical protein